MAMLPFCGYNMGDYFRHWIEMRKEIKYPPRIYYVNWFRKDSEGKFLWPGFGENMRVLKWIVDRCEVRGRGRVAPGWLPGPHYRYLDELKCRAQTRHRTSRDIDHEEWQRELAEHENFSPRRPASRPEELQKQRQLAARFKA